MACESALMVFAELDGRFYHFEVCEELRDVPGVCCVRQAAHSEALILLQS